MKKPRKFRFAQKPWRVPDALKRFLHGGESSSSDDERLLWLMGEFQRLLYADYAFEAGVVSLEIRNQIHLAWTERLKTNFPLPDTTFFEDLSKAHRRFHEQELKTPKQCLAEAYIVLAQPEGCARIMPGGEVAFLERHGGRIDTATVKEYAAYLWADCRERDSNNLQLELNLEGPVPTMSENHWYRLFDELGLTEEFLPRSRGGRPPKAAKKKNVRRPKNRRTRS
jgi:hypothetical protein